MAGEHRRRFWPCLLLRRKAVVFVLLAVLLVATPAFSQSDSTGKPLKWIVDACPTVLFRREAGRLYQYAEARIAYWLTNPRTFKGRVEVEDLGSHVTVSTEIGDVVFGDRKDYRVRVPDIPAPTRLAFRLYDVSAGAPGVLQNEVVKNWTPQRKWTVWLVPSSHIDLYSTANADITPEQHRRILDTVIELCGRFPRYTFQLETRLPIYEYMDGSRSPEQVRRLIGLIKAGRIDVGAEFTGVHHFTSSGESYIQGQMVPWSLGIDLEKDYGIKPEFCAIYDTPGVMKQLPEFLNKAGVRHLVYAPNTSYHIQELMGVPYIFSWKTESGAEVLTWRTSYGYNQEKMSYFKLTDPDPRVQERSVNEKLMQRQESRDEKGNVNPDLAYPFDRYAIPWDYGDNEPADAGPVEFMESWNSRWAYPRFRLGSYKEFLDGMRSRYGSAIPVRRGELANPWEYVVMNQGVINLYDRYCQRALGGAQKCWSFADLLGLPGYPEGKLQEAWDNLARLEAHDWFYGARLDPDTGELIPDFMNPDWAKAEWSLIAERNSREAYGEGLSVLFSQIDTRGENKIAVFNQLSYCRAGPVVVKAPVGLDDGRFKLRNDVTGEEIPYQLIDAAAYQDCFGRRPAMKNQNEHFEGAYPDPPVPSGRFILFEAKDVPGMGFMTYSLMPQDGQPRYPSSLVVQSGLIENQYYRVTVDPATGAVTGVFDKELGKEIVDTDAKVGGRRIFMNQFLKGTPSIDSLGLFINIPPFSDDRRLWQPFLDAITRNSVKKWESDFAGTVQVAQTGPVMGALLVSGRDRFNVPRRQAIVLYDGIKRIDFVNWVKSTGCRPFERYALSFPLHVERPFSVRYHNPYSVCDVGKDELPGGPSPQRHLGEWIEFAGRDLKVEISSPDVGSFTLGRPDVNLVDDARYVDPQYPYYFPVYLDTCAWSAFVVPGSYTMRFSLSSRAPEGDGHRSHRRGTSYAYPLDGMFINNRGGLLTGSGKSLFSVNVSNVDIAVVKKARNGAGTVLRLVENEGKSVRATVTIADFFHCRGAHLTGLNEKPIAPLPHSRSRVTVKLKPYEVLTVRLDF